MLIGLRRPRHPENVTGNKGYLYCRTHLRGWVGAKSRPAAARENRSCRCPFPRLGRGWARIADSRQRAETSVMPLPLSDWIFSIFKAFHGSDRIRVTRPGSTRLRQISNTAWPDPARPASTFGISAGRVMTREKPWIFLYTTVRPSS